MPLSFDIFDTLIARRCIRAVAVFEEMERRLGAAGFAALRINAERSVSHIDYQLADIYEAIARSQSLDDGRRQALMELEIAIELENVLPIADALAKVEDDSLLITDMYLPEDVIRRLLLRAGLPAHMPLLRSASGKRTGRVWAALAAAGQQLEHEGDNVLADVRQPEAAGMVARLATLTEPTGLEKALLEAGFTELAQTLRAARLATPSRGLDANLLCLQTELNLPVLVISALHLLATAGELPQLNLLFSARDARYLKQVYDALAPVFPGAHPRSHYWYSSRLARLSNDETYHAYCREKIGAAAWLVDLCGTGASVMALRERLGMSAQQAQLFVCEFIDAPNYTMNTLQRYGLKQWQPPAALWTNRNLVNNEVLELLNYVPEGMVSGVIQVPGGYVPRREPLEFAPDVLEGVRAQAAYVARYTEQLARFARPALLDEIRRDTPGLCSVVARSAATLQPQMVQLLRSWLPQHHHTEHALTARLGALS